MAKGKERIENGEVRIQKSEFRMIENWCSRNSEWLATSSDFCIPNSIPGLVLSTESQARAIDVQCNGQGQINNRSGD